MVRTDGSFTFLPGLEEPLIPLAHLRPVPPTPLVFRIARLIDRTDVCATDLHLERLSSETHSVSDWKPVGLFQWCVAVLDLSCISISYPVPSLRSCLL